MNGSSLDGVESRSQLRRSGNSLSGVASMIGVELLGIQHQPFPRLADMAEVAETHSVIYLLLPFLVHLNIFHHIVAISL